ncbi:MAG: hypothetical protein HY820_30735 [Acidobacteria bacterium]|nr:hypothetical protein [Acidobacteriota bacterium]
MTSKRAAQRLNRDIFINCPFDDEYAPLFRAICFTCLACEFTPRCSLEDTGAEKVRFLKICELIKECDLGIHDISRTEAGASGLPRFNMPFELGLYLGATRFGDRRQQRKAALIFDRERYRYQRFLSDIAGQDPESHESRADVAIERVRSWLGSLTEEPLPGPIHVKELYVRFQRDLPASATLFGFDENSLPFVEMIRLMTYWLRDVALSEEIEA